MKNILPILFLANLSGLLTLDIDKSASPSENLTLLSTKTPYYNSKKTKIFPVDIDGFTVEYVTLLSRHGSRYPSIKDTKSIIHVLNKLIKLSTQKLQEELEMKDLLEFVESNINEAENLSEIGRKDIFNLAERMKIRLDGYFSHTRLEDLIIIPTCRQRTKQSAVSFFQAFDYFGDIPCEDELLRFFDSCMAYNPVTSMNEHKWKIETKKMAKSRLSLKLIEELNKRISCNNCMNFEDMLNLIKTCAYTLNVLGVEADTGVCSLFDHATFDFFDYYFDMKHYLKRGPSHPMNCEISCDLLKRINNEILTASKNFCYVENKIPEGKRGAFYFGHAETILPLLCLMGVFNQQFNFAKFQDINVTMEEEINADNYNRYKNDNRFFRMGDIVPMGANLAFHLLCPINKLNEPLVLVLLNEEPLLLPCCSRKDKNKPIDLNLWGCTLKQFINCFKSLIRSCSLKEICRINNEL